ncbi:GntR family transcriptional regulator [Oceanobacillus luteolus]|uniref:GntR family transcriptional regulator n=1 Tax=Oceanobacillus luteolus TaxID=1274358 RepID=A0ABW4HPI3_9BACI|nr:GntR family transcriptional regulator [Oceanobacillus luteolus]MCM3739526.1 GntR family transcriptional regulator [Oceanobacillus luteolus]
MFIKMDMAADKPIYIQLKEQIIEGIARKELQPGDDLPSVRSLAADIGINVHTVNKVYQQLKQEGYIQIHRKRGVIIHPDGFLPADENYINSLKEELRPLLAASICHNLTIDEFKELSDEIYLQILNKEGEQHE